MPYKHQAESYRTINGQRWESWGDFNEEEIDSEIATLKALGWKVRRFSMEDGMIRLFRFKEAK